MRGICYHNFSMDNLQTCHWKIIVRYMWWFVGIFDLQCFTSGTWVIIDGPPLTGEFPESIVVYPDETPWTVKEIRQYSITMPHSWPTVLPRTVRAENV